MQIVSVLIKGIPYAQLKSRGDKLGPVRWSEAVVVQTQHLPKIKQACLLKLTFLLPANKFPFDFPYGPDVDNLLKRTLDALQLTIFSEAKGKDSCVIAVFAMKTKIENDSDAGAHLEVLPVSF
jgi:hypothetical protein